MRYQVFKRSAQNAQKCPLVIQKPKNHIMCNTS